jgi:hypothetical protein
VLGQQRTLSTILAFNKALHGAPELMRYSFNVYSAGSVYLARRFYTAWAKSGHARASY